MDNASPNGWKQTTGCLTSLGLVSAPHPPYSPDLTPSEFSEFGKVKNSFTGKKFVSADEILHKICHVSDGIGRDELNGLFPNGKKDYKNASIWTEGMCPKRILKISSVL
jgi:hypothetical protein